MYRVLLYVRLVFVISIKTKLPVRYFHDLSLFNFKFRLHFFAVTCCVCVVHKMFVEVYNNARIRNERNIAKFLLTPVAMQELKVAAVANIQAFPVVLPRAM
jgi:hypothetical protein